MKRTSFRTRYSALCIAVVMLLTGAVTPLDGQGVGTVGAVVAGANSVLQKLQNVGTTLTGNAQIAAGDAATQLSILIHQVETTLGGQFATPVNNLSANARLSVDRLQQITEQLNFIVGRQQSCIFANLDLFVASLSTAALDMKRGLIIVHTGAPRLDAFKFSALNTPNLVPRSGGMATLRGFRLWDDPQFPPEVAIVSPTGNVITHLTPSPAGNANQANVTIEPRLVQAHAGECLTLRVNTFRRKSILGLIPTGREQTATLAVPMCVPDEYQRQISLTANIQYGTDRQVERTLAGRRFGWGNSSCEDRKNVSQTEDWGAAIPAGYRIVRVATNDVDARDQSNIGIDFTATSVTAHGWLDDASCVEAGFIHHLDHDTHWYATLVPVIAGQERTEAVATATGRRVGMSLPQTRSCANVPVPGNASGSSTVWVTINQYVGGQELPQPLYSSTRLTDPDRNTLSNTVHLAGYQFDVTYNPTIVGGTCEVCATVTSPSACGW